MAHLLPAPGNYPQFIGVVGFMAGFLQAKLRGKEKQTKAREETDNPAGNVA